MGKLNLIIGPMYSGKTSELLNRYRRYKLGNKKCLLVKFEDDTRYDNDMITTHDGIKYEAIKCKKLSDINDKIISYDVICIDEIQFYRDALIIDEWSNYKIIIACGLNGDFKREPFDIISKLIPKADNILHMTAVCRNTGNTAPFTLRLSDDEEQQVIGGLDKYEAVSREYYMKMYSIKKN